MWVAAALLALGLAGCSAADPRIALPLTAPQGADPLVRDFIEICSQALGDETAATAKAVQLGWQSQSDPDADHFNAHMFSKPGGGSLQIMPLHYPHLDVHSCMVFGLLDGANAPDLSVIGKTAGLQGNLDDASSKLTQGLWSFIGPDGEPVTINAFTSVGQIVQMSMSTTRRVAPPQVSKN